MGKTVTGFPEDKNPEDMDLERPETFPDEDEWRSPPHTSPLSEPKRLPLSPEEMSALRDATPGKPSSPREESTSNSPPLQVLTTEEQSSLELNGSFNGGCIWKEQWSPDWVRIRNILD